MFWKKKQIEIAQAEVKTGTAAGIPTMVPPVVKVVPAKTEKLHGPQDLPMPVGRDIVTKFHKDPDLAWRLKCVMRPSTTGKKVSDVRVFSESDAAKKKVKVKDYNTMNEHPELILFEGWVDTGKGETKLEERKAAAP